MGGVIIVLVLNTDMPTPRETTTVFVVTLSAIIGTLSHVRFVPE
jgi:hypothetical protein